MAPLPDVTLTIRDGSLGIIPPSSANTQLKLGVSALGVVNAIYSVSDNATLTSQLGRGGPLVDASAISLSVASGPMYCVPVNPSVAGTLSAVTKVGSGAETMTVAAKNAMQILLKFTLGGAVATSTFALSFDGGATYGPSFATAATLALTAAGCPLVTLAFSGTATVGDIWTIATTGVATQTTGAGAETVSVNAAMPLDTYVGLVTIAGPGLPGTSAALGTATFTWSLDNGVTTSAQTVIPSSGVFVIPDSGVVLTFTGSSTVSDTFTFTSVAPGFATGDVTTAFTAILADARTWGIFHLVGAATSVGAAATMLSTLDSQFGTAANNFRFTFGFLEVPSDTDANTIAAFNAASSPRVSACAGYAYTISPITARTLKRNSAWHASARAAAVVISQDLGRLLSGPLQQIPGALPNAVAPLVRDEFATPGLDAARFLTLRSFPGRNGFFITNPRLMAPAGSDFVFIQYRRVMDVASAAARNALLTFLNDSVRTNADGTIQERDARVIEQYVDNQIRAALSPGNIVDLFVTVSRTNNVLSTQTIFTTIRVQPLGYAKFITVDIGFINPNLIVKTQ